MQIQKITVLTLAHYLITDETKDSDVTELTKITLPVIKMSCSLVAAEGSIISRDFLRRNGGKIHRPRRTFFFLPNSFPNSKRPHRKAGLLKKLFPAKKKNSISVLLVYLQRFPSLSSARFRPPRPVTVDPRAYQVIYARKVA